MNRGGSNLRDRLSLSSVVELAVGSVAASLTACVLVFAVKRIADIGDLLGFAGAFVGAVVTIGGAVWVDRRRLSERELADRRYLVDCIHRIEELASLDTKWLLELEREPFKPVNATAIALLMQIRTTFAETIAILDGIRASGFTTAAWTVRVAVNLTWLRDRAEEGLRGSDDPRYTWRALLAQPESLKEYLSTIQHASATMLVLTWRILLILGERPQYVDHGHHPIDAATVISRHERGWDF